MTGPRIARRIGLGGLAHQPGNYAETRPSVALTVVRYSDGGMPCPV